ncbi:serine/threonine-protein kinase [Catellatospora tritici]|uniref:serine/threonine-protein kinase n=1 Tax=Catellatospora tritici TaxID=2851566 RepID=UPI001C2D05C7|nr:serine/threonine-protein kinase [Catellatospora tritici]MBV1855503.1 serine/threonine protein kinase [Catellatospora tritici]
MRPLETSDPISVGSYRLAGVLGGGGMGRVYLGHSPSGRRVAVKVIRPELAADPVFRRRFSREVAAARSVSPLFTAAVVDADTQAQAPWLATAFIDGPSLERQVAEHGPLSEPAVLTLATGLAEALASIHRVGLTHRDLKPANVLLDDDGPHIIDFGIALDAADDRMTTSVNVGTPSYMAPERIQGEESGPPGDVFSLGALLYFAATGRTLISGGSMFEQINQVTQGRFDLAKLSPTLRPFIVRCVSLRPQDRPTAVELARILIGTGVSGPTPGWYEPRAPRALPGPGSLNPPTPPEGWPHPAPSRLPRLSRRALIIAGAGGGAALIAGVAWALGRGSGSPNAQASPQPSLHIVSDEPDPSRTGDTGGRGDVIAQAASHATAEKHRLIVDGKGRIIGANGGHVFARDVRDDTEVWTKQLNGAQQLSVYDWGPSVLVTGGSKIWRVNAASGGVEFDVDTTSTVTGALTSPELAFIQQNAKLLAYTRAGVRSWELSSPEEPLTADSNWLVTRRQFGSTVTITLRAAGSGDRAWQQQFPAGPNEGPPGGGGPGGPGDGPGGPGGPDGPPPDWVVGEARLVGAHVLVRDGADIRLLRLSNGSTVWQRQWERPVATITLFGDLVVLGADRIVAFRLASGDDAWLGPNLRGSRLAAAPDSSMLYVVGDEHIAAITPDGKTAWNAPMAAADEGAVEALLIRPPLAYLVLRPPPFPDSNEPDVLAVALEPQA